MGEGTLPVAIDRLQQQLSKYQTMERALLSRLARIEAVLEEVGLSLEAICRVSSMEQETVYRYELGPTLYGEALLGEREGRFGLWLGANVMVEYPEKEALSILEKRQSEQELSKLRTEHDVEYCRKQRTTVEVALARLYNFGLALKKATIQT